MAFVAFRKPLYGVNDTFLSAFDVGFRFGLTCGYGIGRPAAGPCSARTAATARSGRFVRFLRFATSSISTECLRFLIRVFVIADTATCARSPHRAGCRSIRTTRSGRCSATPRVCRFRARLGSVFIGLFFGLCGFGAFTLFDFQRDVGTGSAGTAHHATPNRTATGRGLAFRR